MADPSISERKPVAATRGLNRLTALEVKNAKARGWYGDGGGLYLEVDSHGRRWVLRLAVAGRRRDMGLGPLHKVSLAQARIRAAEYRSMAYQGVDPVAAKRARRPAPVVPSFEKAATEVHRSRMTGWSNGKHVDQWINTLRDHAFPLIGALPVNAIGTPEVLKVLTPIWLTKPETARRVRQRLKTVLEWARAAGHRSGENPVDLIGDALPKASKANVEHHAALPFAEVGAFVRALRAGQSEPVTKLAFELLILTASRTIEIRRAKWEQFDWEARTWTRPAEDMKARREHVVPLSPRAVAVLTEAKALGNATEGSVHREPVGPAAVREPLPQCARGHRLRRALHAARLPLLVPRLGGRDHHVSFRGRGDGARTHHQEQGRSRLPARRPLGQAARADGRVGGLRNRVRVWARARSKARGW